MYKIKTEVFTAKGKIKPKVRTAINDDLGAKLMLTNGTEVVLERKEDGKFYGIIAESPSGAPIFAKVEVVITEKPYEFKSTQIDPVKLV